MNQRDVSTGPLVSVIIPTFNRPELLKEALGSVVAQTYENLEAIVINDGGESIKQTIEPFGRTVGILSLAHEANKGLPAARNTGLQEARGKYIAYLDDDDIYYPEHIECLVSILEQGNCSVAYTDANYASQWLINDQYFVFRRKVLYSFDFDRERLLEENYIPVINIMHAKRLLEKAGLFDESLRVYEDWDLLIRLSRHTDFHHIKKVTAEVRVRGDGTNMIATRGPRFLSTMKALHKKYAAFAVKSGVQGRQKSVEKRLEELLEARYANSVVHQSRVLHRYAFVRQALEGKTVLDVKCGTGEGLSSLAQHDVREAFGIESDMGMLKKASSGFSQGNVHFINGRFGRLPLKSGKKFDAVLCFRGLEYEDEQDRIISQLREFVKKDGLLLIAISPKDVVTDAGDGADRGYRLDGSLKSLRSLLTRYFTYVVLFGQEVSWSSWLFPIGYGAESEGFQVKTGAAGRGEGDILAIASDQVIELPEKQAHCFDFSALLLGRKGLSPASMEEKMDAFMGDGVDLCMEIHQKDKDLATVEAEKQGLIGDLVKVEAEKCALARELKNMKESRSWRIARRLSLGYHNANAFLRKLK